MLLRRVLLVCALVACSPPPKTRPLTFDDVPTRFEDLAVVVSNHLHALDPMASVMLGLHDYDGKLPDLSPGALDTAIAQLTKDRQALLAAEASTARTRVERDVLLQAVTSELFDRVELDRQRTNPMAALGAINLDAYIIRDYAPLAQRAQAVIDQCRALPAYLAQSRAGMKLPMPRPWIDTALMIAKGLVDFVDRDVRQQLAVTIPLANHADIGPALDTCKKALTEHVAWLEQQQPSGTATFALGPERFKKMLLASQGVDIDLARLAQIAEDDLARNTKALEEATHAIDPRRAVRDVVLAEAEDRPLASELLELATQQTEAMRRFVQQNRIATIPSGDVALVRESPPFDRWNFASLNSPGPFETAQLPAFYYISPPDPSWPAEEQRTYIRPRNDLLFTTIHEVWPGHFLQALHLDRTPSQVLRSFWTYTNVEGWAHYTEEMMYEAGVDRTPQARIGMVKEALLRDVRFLAALGLHTKGMTVEQATQLFADKALTDPGNARQQAMRGTFDPMYLSYTLGKLMIRKLAADWLQRNPGASLGDFHDQFLSYGCAPIPVIRRQMLGDDSPVL